MRPVRHLTRLSDTVERRLSRIQAIVDRLAVPADFGTDGILAFAVIELDNLWSAFVRSYYLSWHLGTTRGSGTRVHVTPGAPQQFAHALKQASIALYGRTTRGRTGRIEPAWHEKRVLVDLARNVAPALVPHVQAAMSLPSTAFDHLHTVRNFYAHRSEETASKLPRVARAFGLLPTRRARDIVLGVPPGGRSPILLEWIGEVRDATSMLCS